MQQGGRRRIDLVLGEGFLDGLPELPVDQLRERRAEAEQEETDLSYARRLLHGRLDLLRAEQERRSGPGTAAAPGSSSDAELVATLSRTLADPPGPSHGMGRHGLVEPSRVGEQRAAVQQAADALAEELGRRYRDGVLHVEDVLDDATDDEATRGDPLP